MPTIDLSSYKVANLEVSSNTKFDNLVQAIQDAFNSLDDTNFVPGTPLQASKISGLPTLIPPTFMGYFGNAEAALTFPVANSVYLVPLVNVVASFTFTRFGYGVGVASGNFDLGVYYSDDEATFTRLGSLGSTAVPAAGTKLTTIASQTITPVAGRRWYIAVACSNTTAAFKPMTDAPAGGYSKAASFPLPATLNAMTAIATSINIPAVSLLV